MRILTLILATFLLLGSTGLGLLGFSRGWTDAEDVEALVGKDTQKDIEKAQALGMQDKLGGELLSLAQQTGKLRTGAFLLLLAGVTSLVLLGMTFANKGVKVGAGLLVVLAAAAVIISPSYDLGPLAPASAKELAMIVAGFAVVGALCAFGASALKNRRTATA
jgi:hypothetical protein